MQPGILLGLSFVSQVSSSSSITGLSLLFSFAGALMMARAIRDQQMLPRPASTVLVDLRLSDLRLRLPGRISLRNSSGLLNIPPSSLHDPVTIPRLLVFIAFYIHTPRVPDKAPHRGVVVKLLFLPALPIPSVLCSPKPTMRQDPSSPVTAFRYDQ